MYSKGESLGKTQQGRETDRMNDKSIGKSIRMVKTHNGTKVPLICLICEKQMSRVPLGQRFKLDATRPHFWHDRCPK